MGKQIPKIEGCWLLSCGFQVWAVLGKRKIIRAYGFSFASQDLVWIYSAHTLIKLKQHGWISKGVLCSVVSNSLQLHGLYTARFLCRWNFSGKNTGVGCHFLLQGIFPSQGLKLHLLHWQVDCLPLHHLGSPIRRGDHLLIYNCHFKLKGVFNFTSATICA